MVKVSMLWEVDRFVCFNLWFFFFIYFFLICKLAIRQNSNGYGSTYNGQLGYRNSVEDDDEMGSFTDYGSVVGSFPPSPAGSFRSAIDAPGFSR